MRLALLAALCLAASLVALRVEDPFVRAAGGVGVAIAAAAPAFAVARAVRPGFVLRIDDEGLLDRSSAVSVGRIAWSEIDRVELCQVRGVEILGVHLADPEAFARARPWWARAAMRVNGWLGCPPVNVVGSSAPSPSTRSATGSTNVSRERAAAPDARRAPPETRAHQSA